jgi:hypothetical protein
MKAADAELVGDGSVALIVGGIARVDGDFQITSPNVFGRRFTPAFSLGSVPINRVHLIGGV